ncbi:MULTISPECIES: DUF2188 domain-containing protein [Salimicrobium]|uniref:DUF2188 domain-containing protein n=4 Tax=Salimicrobium TaxID=351195 RepID=K2G9Z9_9BACI|nr:MULTISPECIES: DUF2188 domain-containing protein [Salimicrobium]AKG03634.1 hypothetical protein AAV35_001755 [Salimicrobium jeotgali]EKE31918.1 hypothetical protein MJ3_05918 [Salimicrobium jeotgali]MBM7696101.1 putative membrane-anchored protein [Salimicrobium jeotgali]PBB04795.1 DUF2188 domain-containing protein [Salimicrobium humidisoli]SDX83447.1 hypothetical protein SAMN04488081_1426 [Salimicrobium album]
MVKEYSVVQNKDKNGWYIKIEDIAPTDFFEDFDSAVSKAEEIAKKNSPSKVLILDQDDNVQEERSF